MRMVSGGIRRTTAAPTQLDEDLENGLLVGMKEESSLGGVKLSSFSASFSPIQAPVPVPVPVLLRRLTTSHQTNIPTKEDEKLELEEELELDKELDEELKIIDIEAIIEAKRAEFDLRMRCMKF